MRCKTLIQILAANRFFQDLRKKKNTLEAALAANLTSFNDFFLKKTHKILTKKMKQW